MKNFSYSDMLDMLEELGYEIEISEDFSTTQKNNAYKAIQVLTNRINKLSDEV